MQPGAKITFGSLHFIAATRTRATCAGSGVAAFHLHVLAVLEDAMEAGPGVLAHIMDLYARETFAKFSAGNLSSTKSACSFFLKLEDLSITK
jgi:hypothetical protein